MRFFYGNVDVPGDIEVVVVLPYLVQGDGAGVFFNGRIAPIGVHNLFNVLGTELVLVLPLLKIPGAIKEKDFAFSIGWLVFIQNEKARRNARAVEKI